MEKKQSIMSKIAGRLESIYYVTADEMRNVFRDTGVMIFFFVVPLAYPLLYTFIYNNETVREVPVVLIDNASTPQSRDFARRVDGTPDVRIAYRATDMDHARELLARKEAYGIIYIPSDFSRNIGLGGQSHVSLYCDMSSLLFYKAMLVALTDVSLEMGAEIEQHNLHGLTEHQQETASMPIENEWVALFNPQSGFASFLIPAILIIIIQQTLLLGVGMLAGTARQNNALHRLVPKLPHYNGTFRVVLGKGLAYFIIYVVVTMYMVEAVPSIFSIPKIGLAWTKVLFLLPFLTASIFFAMFLSTVMKGRESPMLVFVFTSVPILFISGVSWPEAAVPDFWKWIGWVIPSTHGVQGFIKINTMGASIYEVTREYIALWVLTGIYMTLTCMAYRRIIRKNRLQST